MKKIMILGCITAILCSCAVIRPGEVGIKQKFGKLKGKTKTQGLAQRHFDFYGAFIIQSVF